MKTSRVGEGVKAQGRSKGTGLPVTLSAACEQHHHHFSGTFEKGRGLAPPHTYKSQSKSAFLTGSPGATHLMLTNNVKRQSQLLTALCSHLGRFEKFPCRYPSVQGVCGVNGSSGLGVSIARKF